jgi:2-methylcitrate dehydratase PrpD
VPIVCEPLAGKRQPGSDYEAKFSLPYAVASGLLHGRLGLKELEPSAYLDSNAQALMSRVRYVVDPDSAFPRGYSGEVRVTLADGTQHRHRENLNRGCAEVPLTNEEVRDKFMDNASLHFSSAHARAVCDLVLSLDRLPAAGALEDLLAREPSLTGEKKAAA